jgi:hypothetical protein
MPDIKIQNSFQFKNKKSYEILFPSIIDFKLHMRSKLTINSKLKQPILIAN